MKNSRTFFALQISQLFHGQSYVRNPGHTLHVRMFTTACTTWVYLPFRRQRKGIYSARDEKSGADFSRPTPHLGDRTDGFCVVVDQQRKQLQQTTTTTKLTCLLDTFPFCH